MLLAVTAVLAVPLVLSAASLMTGPTLSPDVHGADEVVIPERFVDTAVGRVPDVSGMRLHHAARMLASHRLYPILEDASDNDSTLQVARLVDVREIDDSLPESTTIESPRYGWMAFDRDGDWAGAVVLALSG